MSKPITATWSDWLKLNRDRGCNLDKLIEQALAQGFDRASIEAVLNDKVEHVSMTPLDWFNAPLTKPDHLPRAWRLDTPLAQVYELPGLLNQQECNNVIAAINKSLLPSTTTTGATEFRTSRTCHIRRNSPNLARRLDQRFSALFGVDPALSEPIQGQRYDPGQYFKMHKDWFTPGSKAFEKHCSVGGQRTWTLMVYLNAVEEGGETYFKDINRSFTPVTGLGLAWNNLQPDGTPNNFTMHEAMPVLKGNKWVITKWFREQPGLNHPPKK